MEWENSIPFLAVAFVMFLMMRGGGGCCGGHHSNQGHSGSRNENDK